MSEGKKTNKIIFMGTPDFAVPALKKLFESGYNIDAVVSQPNKAQGRKQIIKATPVAAFAQERNIHLLQPKSINDPDTIQAISELKPDLIVTAAYGQILTKEILELPRLGCINIHASLLPLYRGAAPINAAIIDRQAETGITIMQMDEGCDTGDILFQNKIKVNRKETAGSLFAKLAKLGGSVIIDFLPEYFAGNITPVAQDNSKATYAPKMSRKSGEIDWNKSASEIEALIRGTQPWPGSYTHYKKDRMKIFDADIIEQKELQGVPGELLSCDAGLLIQCGINTVRLKEIQIASGRQMSTEICSHNYRQGSVLGRAKSK